MTRAAVFIVLIIGICLGSNAFAQIRSGFYDGTIPLYVAFDSVKQEVTGYVGMRTEPSSRVLITCQLYFTGKMNKSNKASVTLHQYGVDSNYSYEGELIVESSQTLRLMVSERFGSCDNFMSVKDGETADFSHAKPYKKISLINVDKQYLYSSPEEKAIKKAYLVKYDPVGVMQEKGEWILVRYLTKEKTEAWIPKKNIL